MRRNFIKLFTLLSISLCILLSACTFSPIKSNNKPTANKGVLDLTNWDWKQNGIVDLDGQWEFYWQNLLEPHDFTKIDVEENKNLIVLPRAWNKYLINGDKLSGNGYATYRLLIRNSSDEILGIKIPRIFTSYKLWANGELIASSGKLSISSEHIIPQYLPQIKYIKSKTNTIELIIQVANFNHRSGGILESLKIGSASDITEIRIKNLTLELLLFGSLFIIGFYHIALFIFRTKDKSTLYFGIYSLLISARTLLVGEIYFIHLFPNFNWEIAHKIQTLAYYLGVLLVVLFMKATFPHDISKKATTFIQVVGGSFACLVILTPVKIFSYFNPLYQVFSLLVILYVIYIAILTCYKKREGAYLIGLGIIILTLSAINDIAFLSIIIADSDNHILRNFITRGNLSSWGLLIFIFTQSLVLAKNFSKSFSKVELLTEELQHLNMNLEEKVKERTFALESSKEKLKEAYQAVSRSEKSLQDLMQNISHDLRTPLSAIKGYANAILDGVVKEGQQNKYLKRIVDKINLLNNMVQELFDLSQLQSRQLKLTFTKIPVNFLIKNILEKYSIDMINKNLTFRIHYPQEFKNDSYRLHSLFVIVDSQKIERVFTNLLNNAVKYTPLGGSIEVFLSFIDEDKKLLVEVSDTGIGIPKEDLPHIFQRFYMVSKTRQTNTNSWGLGLAIVKEIIEYHNGEIWAESKVNEGSHFFFTLPLYTENESNSKLLTHEI